MKSVLLLALAALCLAEKCDELPGQTWTGTASTIAKADGTFQGCCDACRQYAGCIAFYSADAGEYATDCLLYTQTSGNTTFKGYTSGICHRQPTPAPPPTAPTYAPRTPPDMPPQLTAKATTNGASLDMVYSDATTKRVASISADTYTILDCGPGRGYKYSNAGLFPGVPAAKCTTSKSSPYGTDCPSAISPGWPPAAYDFYFGFKAYLKYTGPAPCPLAASETCDRYFFDYYNNSYETQETYINVSSNLPYYATGIIGATKYVHELHPGVDPSMLERPDDCPDPDGPCKPCIDQCGACTSCKTSTTGSCAACWAKDPTTGSACLPDCVDAGCL